MSRKSEHRQVDTKGTDIDYLRFPLPLEDPGCLVRAALPLPLLATLTAFRTFKTSSPPLAFFDEGSRSSLERIARFCDFSALAETSVGSNCKA